MLLSIRTKLFVMCAIVSVPIFVLLALTYQSGNILLNAIQNVWIISNQRQVVSNLCICFDKVLMPANDYIITGNKKYIDDFHEREAQIEKCLMEARETLPRLEGLRNDGASGEGSVLNDMETAWQQIRELSSKIFAITHVIGNREAARLMEEMDYTWGYPTIEKLRNLRKMLIERYMVSMEMLRKTWNRVWLSMIICVILLISVGIIDAFLVSKKIVFPIMAIQNGAKIVAEGNFDYCIDVHTGDEIEQLAKTFNVMSGRLKESYASIENKVRERTEELNQRVEELERFGKVTINREFRIKELKDKVEELEKEIKKLKDTGGKTL